MSLMRTVSLLPEISNPIDTSIMEVSVPVSFDEESGTMAYMSKKVQFGNVRNVIKNVIIEDLSSDGAISEWYDIKNLSNEIHTIKNEDLKMRGDKNIEGKLSCQWEYDTNTPNSVINFQAMESFVNQTSPIYIGPDSTPYGDINIRKDYNTQYYLTVIGQKSNEIECEQSGIFTCFGWLDEIENSKKNNSSRWVALEGQFNINGNTEWRILQLQPFISNVYCSYVGFTFPVKQGLKIRISTGFNVGTNSNKYGNSDNSLTINKSNTFVGSIYGA